MEWLEGKCQKFQNSEKRPKVVGASKIATRRKKGTQLLSICLNLGRKLGNLLDGTSSTEPEFDTVENQEVLGEFLQKAELEALQYPSEIIRLETRKMKRNRSNGLKN